MRGTIRMLQATSRFRAWWVRLLALTVMFALPSCGAAEASSAKGAAAPRAASADAVMYEMPGPEPAPGAPGGEMAGGSDNALGAQAPPPPGDADGAVPGAAPGDTAQVLASAEKASPLLIYRAMLTMAVFETRKVMDAIEALAKATGGYLVTRDDLSITIRVPASKFDATLTDIAAQGDELHRQVEVSDVTEQYNDLSIELKNAEVVRERLVVLLDKAQKVEEALAVEAELARLTDKIERIKGRLKLLKELVTFSTVTVRFQARPVERVDSKVQLPFPWLKQLGLGELLSL